MYRLSDGAQEILKRLFAAYSAIPFPAGQEEKHRPKAMCRAELELALLELRREEWLELRQKLWGERLYRIPEQRIPAILQAVTALGPPTSRAEAGSGVSSGPPLAAEVFRMLAFMADGGVALTAKGAIHKAAAGRLTASLSGEGERLKAMLPPSGGMVNLPPAAAVLLDLLLALGLAVKESGAITLVPAALAAWLQLTEPEMNDRLYQMILARSGTQEPALLHFRYWITGSDLLPGAWFSLPDTLAVLEQAGLTAGQTIQELLEASGSWLKALAGCGWMELASAAGGEPLFRWTKDKPRLTAGHPSGERDDEAEGLSAGGHAADPATAAQFIVQPDLEVLVPPEVPYSVRWTLFACAELQDTEAFWSFRLSRQRLEQAAEHGLEPGQVIAWLAEHAMGGLPEQAEQALRLWARGIGRTALSEAILLTCRSLEEAELIAAHPRLRLARLGPLHFAVPAADVEPLRKELAAAGMAPPRAFAGREAAGPALQALFLGGPETAPGGSAALPSHGTAKESGPGTAAFTELPLIPPAGPEEAAGGEGVPQMWLKEWRHYHASTAMQMMEHALERGYKVQVAVQGEACEFIPERSHGIPWRVSGTLLRPGTAPEEAMLAAGDWREMKLLLPAARRNSSSAVVGDYGMIRKSTGSR
ncbi:helicase-associated domain-containing protein [Paenibacillus tepidiphilus]|uniref:helicase-associated domain-containing protein n=1 Tax=Paenibacillus tepidiphilus TaxID=2608683 RepID=UPI0013A575A1|nr:helicase-associated domain-containing protein [Paenibacillus tepidiphilus]